MRPSRMSTSRCGNSAPVFTSTTVTLAIRRGWAGVATAAALNAKRAEAIAATAALPAKPTVKSPMYERTRNTKPWRVSPMSAFHPFSPLATPPFPGRCKRSEAIRQCDSGLPRTFGARNDGDMTEPFVRPDVRQLLEFLDNLPGPKSHEVGPEGARQMMVAGRYALDAPARDIAVMRDVAGPVPLRLYDAREERGPSPVLAFIHGGGWVIGGLETHDPLCIDLAIELDVAVVSVDCRLAPEHPFPAAFDDSLAAAQWIASGPTELGRIATGLFLAGDSAGGNLAAAVS